MHVLSRVLYCTVVLSCFVLSMPGLAPGQELKAADRSSQTILNPLHVSELGSGWANTTINAVIFRHHGIVTRGTYQFTAYYDDESQMAIVRRDLSDDSLQTYRLEGTYNTRDAHNSISLGIDPDGYLHIAYDHHCHPLRYRRSLRPLDVGSWTEPLPMTGELEDPVTYPYFLMAPKDAQDREGLGGLYFMYRIGSSGNGDICLKAYDSSTQTWSDRALRCIKGTEQTPWTANAYWDHPAFDSKGRMHLSWVWRVNRGGPPGELLNNINVGYAYTADMGETWFTSRDRQLPLPITPVNGETIWPISPGNNTINQCSSATDSQDRMHIVSYTNDPDGVPQYFHLWFDGRVWQFQFISQRTEPFTLAGGGTLQIPISRPELLIDSQDRIYVIYRGDITHNRLVMQRLEPPNFNPPGQMTQLWDEDLGHSEPVIDRIRWKRDGVLSMLIQKSYQPNHDKPTDVSAEPVRIVDWKWEH